MLTPGCCNHPCMRLICPFREVTGMPCPLCGATRSFALVAQGDGRWVQYGAVWVVVAAVAMVMLITRARLRVHPGLAAGVTVAVAWAWALAHADTIVDQPG
jgi:hypothetical protein